MLAISFNVGLIFRAIFARNKHPESIINAIDIRRLCICGSLLCENVLTAYKTKIFQKELL